MQDSDYQRLADAAMGRLEAALDAADGDFDHELVAGGVLEIEGADGSKIIVNKQSAAQEIWVAARSGGFHYRWDGQAWRDTRGGEELFAALERLLGEQSGAPVRLGVG
jgi:CyaY protein